MRKGVEGKGAEQRKRGRKGREKKQRGYFAPTEKQLTLRGFVLPSQRVCLMYFYKYFHDTVSELPTRSNHICFPLFIDLWIYLACW